MHDLLYIGQTLLAMQISCSWWLVLARDGSVGLYDISDQPITALKFVREHSSRIGGLRETRDDINKLRELSS